MLKLRKGVNSEHNIPSLYRFRKLCANMVTSIYGEPDLTTVEGLTEWDHRLSLMYKKLRFKVCYTKDQIHERQISKLRLRTFK